MRKLLYALLLCASSAAVASAQCGASGHLVWNPLSNAFDCTANNGIAPSGAASGDLSGTYPSPTVAAINGVVISGVPTAGQIMIATGAATLSWQSIPTQVDPGTGFQPNQTLSGCGVEYTSGLIFSVGACSYTINGVSYTSAITSITLTAADATNPRIDVIAVNTAGNAVKIDGTAASNPQQPTIDPATQLALTFVYVAANGTTPTGITLASIYEENTEWTSAVTANINAASTSNPYRGTKDIEATAAAITNNVTLTKPAAGTENLQNWNTLVFYIRSKAAWPTGNGSGANASRQLSIFWLSGSTQVGVPVLLRDGQFGFQSGTTGSYQQVSIPTSLFGTGSNTVTKLEFLVTGNGGTSTIGFYLDGISLQGGSTPVTIPASTLIRSCEIVIGDPGAASPVLANDNDSPNVCNNDSGATMKITAVHCYADAGSPTVTPIITGGAATSILTGALTCSQTQGGAAGTLQGTPVLTPGQSIDGNITSAGGTAKYIVLRITRTL